MKNILLALIAASSLTAYAQTNVNTLSNCQIQEVIPGKMMTGAFFQLHHEGGEESIISAAIPDLTPMVQLHQMTMKDGVMEMKQVPSFPVKAGDNVYDNSTGFHLMVMNLKAAPAVGTVHTLTLTFDNGETASCEAEVVSVSTIMQKKMPGNMKMEM